MARRQVVEDLSIDGTVWNLTVEDLKPLVRLIQDDVPSRKGELVDVLTRAMKRPKEVHALYDGLSELNKRAVEEAVRDPAGSLDLCRFGAKYGHSPDFGSSGRFRNEPPTKLRLFFPRYYSLPTDLRDLLLTFIPAPPALTVNASDDLPERFRRPYKDLGRYYSEINEEELDLRVRQTARAALQDVKAVLRLVDAGEVRVSDKTRRPSQAALKAVEKVLTDGEFYQADDRLDESWDPASDLAIKAFAWPMLLQAAGLAQLSGNKLQLSPAGRKATTKPAHEVIRLIWDKWLKTSLLDEFNRINVIKGQQGKGKGGLTAVAPRRQSVVAVMRELPPQKWISMEEVFRVTKALAGDFSVSRDPWKLYIAEQQYGSLGYDAHYTWEALQGRYLLAFLFEYAATLGLLDVAYISPVHARNDFCDRWGTDDFSCLSRYDGLMFLRINSLGAWCLGLADRYEPETAVVAQVFKVLPNLDVAAIAPPLSPADVLLLERFAERQSDAVWHLSTAKILAAVEEGLTVAELRDFLSAKNQAALPQTVETFLADLEQKAGKLEDLGSARLIACADAHLARLLASDRRLRKLCELAGDRNLVFRAADETAVRRSLRELGYVLPPVH